VLGHDDQVTSADLLSQAVAQLYASDPDAFTERRGILVAQARAAGEISAAKSIARLRKPTRSAWVVNQLVRAEPGVPSRLAALGDELRAAEGSLAGAKIRELSQARRQLIDALVRQALTMAGQDSPPAALREEITATFAAALADPQVAEQLAAGTLVHAERRAGFGYGGQATPTPVPSPAGRPPVPVAEAAEAAAAATAPVPPARARAEAEVEAEVEAAAAATARAVEAAAAAAVRAECEAAAAAAAKAERERRRAIAEAEQAVADASQAADAAANAEREQESAVRLIEEQLTETRQRLVELRIQGRRAKSTQHKARQALDRLDK
jgi:hypothetical protein